MKLTKDNVEVLRHPLHHVWNSIGHDMYDACAESGDVMDAAYIIEVCIDANRLSTYGGDDGEAADKVVLQLIKEHGYRNVVKFLAETFPMC